MKQMIILDKIVHSIMAISMLMLIGLLVLLYFVADYHNKRNLEFREVCEKSNGKTVFDGRQYQCIKFDKETHDNN